MDSDQLLARQLQEEFDAELAKATQHSDNGFASSSQDKTKDSNHNKTMTIVDPQWELIDPTPDIFALFAVFNERFFWGALHAVEVKWSPRMTSCAGVCVYHSRAGFCSVRLSRPLLILRPRRDLVQTLLHEMIHAFLFVTHNNRDRDGHGPEFHNHMNRINKDAGTRITVYHTFHEEVRLYQKHVWRCNGPCQSRPPFFGIVRRASNRAPGPNDRWFAQHQATCGGQFIKCQEPEKENKENEEKNKTSSGSQDIRSFFPVNGTTAGASSSGSNTASSSGSMGGSGTLSSQPHIVGFKDLASKSADASGSNNFMGGVQDVTKQTKFGSVNNVVGFKDLQNPVRKQGFIPFQGGKGYTLGGKGSSIDGVGKEGGQIGKGPSQRGKGPTQRGKGPTQRGKGPTQRGKGPTQRGTGRRIGGNKGVGFPSNDTGGNFRRGGGGGFGGMLANRGGGTLVVTGKSTKTQEDSDLKDFSVQNGSKSEVTEIFSGTGQTLGSTSGTSTLVRPSFSGASSSGISKPASPRKGSKVIEDVLCPVCNVAIEGQIINSHLDECLKSSHQRAKDTASSSGQQSVDTIIISDDEDDTEVVTQMAHCPVCSTKVEEKEMNAHLNVCVGNAFSGDDDSMHVDSDSPKNAYPKCPICMKEVPDLNLDDHLETCAACTVENVSGVFDEEFSDDEEEDAAIGSPSKKVSDTGELLFPCPCCCNLVEPSKMRDHLDVCLSVR